MLTALFGYAVAAIAALIAAQSSSRWLRYLLCSVVCAAILESFRRIPTVTADVQKASLLGMFLLVWLSHVLHLLLLERVYVPNAGRKRDRWLAAYKVLNTARGFNRDNVKSRTRKTSEPLTPSGTLQRTYSSSPARAVWKSAVAYYSPLRSHLSDRSIDRVLFISKRLLSATAIYIVNTAYEHHLQTLLTSILGRGISIHDFSPIYQHILRRSLLLLLPDTTTSTPPTPITYHECLLRAWFVAHFIWTQWATFTFLHDILAIVHVGVIRIDDPSDWPRFFGSPLQTHTLQKFWARFWHRAVRRTYVGYGTWISRCVLCLTSRGGLDRLVIHGFVFLFSGLAHALVDWALGVCRWELEVWWFAVNFVAVMIEQGLVGSSLSARLYDDRKPWVVAGWRVFGYLWVFGFMFWSLPNAQYPKVYCMLLTL